MKLMSAFLCWFVSKGADDVGTTRSELQRVHQLSEAHEISQMAAMKWGMTRAFRLKHGWLYLPWVASGSAWCFGSRYMTVALWPPESSKTCTCWWSRLVSFWSCGSKRVDRAHLAQPQGVYLTVQWGFGRVAEGTLIIDFRLIRRLVQD